LLVPNKSTRLMQPQHVERFVGAQSLNVILRSACAERARARGSVCGQEIFILK
jgi:hypothetical protein